MAENGKLEIIVGGKQIHETKKARERAAGEPVQKLMVSIVDPMSANHFGSFRVDAADVTAKGSLQKVSLDPDKTYDYSYPEMDASGKFKLDAEGKRCYCHEDKSGQELFDLYQAGRQATKQAEAGTQKAGSREYLNRLPASMVHETKQPDQRRVSIPVGTAYSSDGKPGYVQALIPANRIFQSTDKSGTPVLNKVNINLGSGSDLIKCQVKDAEGVFQKIEIPASDLRKAYDDNQAAYVARQRDAAKQADAPAPDGSQAGTPSKRSGFEDLVPAAGPADAGDEWDEVV